MGGLYLEVERGGLYLREAGLCFLALPLPVLLVHLLLLYLLLLLPLLRPLLLQAFVGDSARALLMPQHVAYYLQKRAPPGRRGAGGVSPHVRALRRCP